MKKSAVFILISALVLIFGLTSVQAANVTTWIPETHN